MVKTFFFYHIDTDGQLQNEIAQIEGGTLQALDYAMEVIQPKAMQDTNIFIHEFNAHGTAAAVMTTESLKKFEEANAERNRQMESQNPGPPTGGGYQA